MMDHEFPDEGLFGEMPGTPAALEEDCVVAARLTLEHVSLARSLALRPTLSSGLPFSHHRH
jgi:hypothetical protein